MDVLRAGELQVGKFFDFNRGRSFAGCRFRGGFGCVFWPRLPILTRGSGGRGLGIPNFLRIDLGLAKGRQVIGDGLFGVETEVLGIGADEAFIEDAARKIVEMFFLDGAQHAGADLGDVGNVVEREFFLLAGLAKLFSEFAHGVRRGRDGNIIGQAEPSGYSQEVKGGVTTELRSQIQMNAGDWRWCCGCTGCKFLNGAGFGGATFPGKMHP